VAHGISSSGLFCFVSMLYEKIHSRSMYINKGLIGLLPLFSLFLFILCASNISAPPSINLLSEILLVVRISSVDGLILTLFAMGSFLGAVFTFYLFSYVHHGKFYLSLTRGVSCRGVEFHVLILHLLPIFFLFLKQDLFFLI